MAALTIANGILRVLEAIGRVSGDTQCPSSAITSRLDTEYRRLRRRLIGEFPSIYEATSSNIVLTGTDDELDKPSGCDTVLLVEKLIDGSSGTWTPLSVVSTLNRNETMALSYFEQGSVLKVRPTSATAGTYRISYVAMPVDGYTTYDLPDGLDDMLVELVAAWARVRHEEDPTPHRQEAARIWNEQYMPLWNRYGAHGQSGLQITRMI